VSLWDGPVTGEPDRTGTVTRLAPEADPSSRTITVFVEVKQDPSSTDRLLPGAFVQGRVRTPDPDLRVLLPRRAIRSGRVMLVTTDDDGIRRIVVHPVVTGYSLDARLPEVDPNETEWVVLALGAEPPAGSLVAVTALGQLEPGVRVLLSDDVPGTDGERP
jgi:multidrug efflux pump subunit AcrA (membrane-fusion protein)